MKNILPAGVGANGSPVFVVVDEKGEKVRVGKTKKFLFGLGEARKVAAA